MAIPRGWMRIQSRVHRALYRWSGGRVGARLIAPVLLLSTQGRRSGVTRTTPLFYVPHGGGWVVVASNGGNDADPHWWRNLQAQPEATVQIGAQETAVRARALAGEEWNEVWPQVVKLYRGYESYRRERTREIPLVALEPI